MITALFIIAFIYIAYRSVRLWVRIKTGNPDLDIGPGYLHRYYVIPRNRCFNVYLHFMYKDDDDRALHDHPWHSVSWMLKGYLIEVTKGFHPISRNHRHLRPSIKPRIRSAQLAHRLEVKKPSITLFCTGPVVRDWGFHCPKGWVPWRDFVDDRDNGKVGKGCGEHSK